MKLDSEEQREELLEMLGTVTYEVTPHTIKQTQAKIDEIFSAIEGAGLEGAQVPMRKVE